MVSTFSAFPFHDPECYGLLNFVSKSLTFSFEEKPFKPKSIYAFPGLFFFNKEVVSIPKSIKPSAGEELKITDVNR
ncbi:glucose-1-phosphate thymidylyltransferase, partial [Leptospira borgpetersenii serovar Hardjo-bovis]|nr:glucose-1-phosphate thymidylyltransferase [Leptospira borgpetersenii serovar Hardjo-bovis]